jgi:DDE superfamily endonuclease/Helix-turn-helix of DDE superfamily endonuclease
LLCRRICIATRGCTSSAASKEPHVFRVLCLLIFGTSAFTMRRSKLRPKLLGSTLLVLVYLRKGETFAEVAAGFGIGTSTTWRYVNETVALLAARAPKLRRAVRDAKKAGHAYVVLDGTLIPVDRVAADRPFYSGKHKRHGMNLQVIASPDGGILWVSGALPGSVHDKKAEWIWGVLAELEAAGLVTLADKGYQGSTYAKIPYKGKNKPESQKQANKAHAKLRSPGERANAQLKNWRILRKLRCCPWRAGQLAKAIHVLQIREA